MKKYKKTLLILFLFIIILFINNNIFASDVIYEKKCQSCNITFESIKYNISTISDSSAGKHLTNILVVSYNSEVYAIAYFSTSSSAHNNNMYLKTYKGITYPYVDGIYNTDIHLYNGTSFAYQGWDGANFDQTGYSSLINNCEILYSSADIYTNSNCNEVFFSKSATEPEYVFPYIADTDEILSNLDSVEDIIVFPGDITKSQLPMVFSIYDSTNENQIFSTNLDTSSPYYLYIVENPDDYWFEINTSDFKNLLVNGNEYLFNIYAKNDVNEFNITRSITYQGTTYIPPTDEDIQTDAIKDQTQKIEEQTEAIMDQTEKIEEQTEVQKSIFARIGDILSYINPLSENFFAYKLIDLLIDALKSLFVPEERILRCIF